MALPTLSRKNMVLASGVALIGGFLVSPTTAAQAATVDPYLNTQLEIGNYSSYSGACTASGGSPWIDYPLTSGTLTKSTSGSYTVVNQSDATDSITVNAKQTAKATVTRNGNTPRSMTFSYSGSYSAVSTKPVSACGATYGEWADLDFEFALAKPMWVETSMSRTSNTYSNIYLSDSNEAPYQDHYGHGWKLTNSTSRLLLPAGEFDGYLEGHARYPRLYSTTGPVNFSGAMTLKFIPTGARVSGPTGNGRAYAATPSSTKCSTLTSAPKITSNKRLAKSITQGTVKVNGKIVKRFGKVPAGKALTVKVPSARDSAVQVQMKTTKGIKTVTSRYIACS